MLSAGLISIYLQGSFALGAADEDSDVDFIVVIREPLGGDGLKRLPAIMTESTT